MNSKSLSYSIIENQDPWDLGDSFVKGVAPMSHERQLSSYAEELVSQYAKYNQESFSLKLSSLSSDNISELLRLFIEFIDREIDEEAIYGGDFSINSEYNCALMVMLKNPTVESRLKFSEVVNLNLILHYQDSLQKILDEACDSYLFNMNEEAGRYPRYDRENGDVFWSKAS